MTAARKRFLLMLVVLPLVWGFAAACDDDDVDDVIDRAQTEVREGATEVREGIDEARTEVADVVNGDDTPEAGGAEGQPSLEIASPEDGDTVDGDSVTVEVDVQDFDVVDKLGEENVDGEGHIHYYLDVDDVPTAAGEPAITDEGESAQTDDTSHTFDNLEPGEHTIAVQLVNNDHTPLEPPVVEEVTITVE
jgi:hypothetical protein